jgi:hypothetical protein
MSNCKWTLEKLQKEALKYNSRKEFYRKSNAAYQGARRSGVLDIICLHMTESETKKWTCEELSKEALKYNTRVEFKKNSSGAYRSSIKLGILTDICHHMLESRVAPWTLDELRAEASKYHTVNEFREKSSGAYQAAWAMSVLNEICSHMGKFGGTSNQEKELFDFIKEKLPTAKRFLDKRVKIPNKPHIKGLGIDIYVPELKRGIEFDGTYWHSDAGLKRSRSHWPQEDVDGYHSIKDGYFQSKGILILHIKEADWLKNKKECVDRCLSFLGDPCL